MLFPHEYSPDIGGRGSKKWRGDGPPLNGLVVTNSLPPKWIYGARKSMFEAEEMMLLENSCLFEVTLPPQWQDTEGSSAFEMYVIFGFYDCTQVLQIHMPNN